MIGAPRFLGAVLLGAIATAQTAAPPLADARRQLLEDPAFAGARVGVLVVDLRDGAVLCEHDADSGFMSASNMKLISSAVALLTLGPEFRFSTTLRTHGRLEDGVLDGDLVLVGAGDPTFGGRTEPDADAVFERMVDRLRRDFDLREIRGRIVGDDDCQPDEIMGDGWSWGYEGADYAAQIGGLCFAENVVRVRVEPRTPGAAPQVTLTPATDFLRVVNEARTVAAGATSTLEVDRRRATNDIVVRGALAADAEPVTAGCSVENPTAFAARQLATVLTRRGVVVHGAAVDRDQLGEPAPTTPERVLVEHRSAPLAEILVTLNKVSQNLYAEQLVRAAARAASGRSDMPAAAAHAAAVLNRLGVDTTGLAMHDGSGLTRLNLVRPRQFVGLLRALWNGPHRDLFVATLPVAGVDGTLAGRFADSPARGRVHAKTGFINRVVALSGYVLRQDAPPLAFSILTNNFTVPTADAKAAVDRFVTALCGG